MEDKDKQEILGAIQKLQENLMGVQDNLLGFQGSFQETIHGLADHMDERFELVDRRFLAIDDRFERIEGDIVGMKQDIGSTKADIIGIRSQMVTKDYLDDKLADLRSDLIVLCRKSDTKLSTLVGSLVKEGSLKQSVADKILAMEPFAQ